MTSQYQPDQPANNKEPIANTMGAVGTAQGSIESGKKVALLVYILQALSFLLGFTSIVGLIINYVKRADVRGTWLESHFRWQIRTFWFGVLWSLIGWLLVVVYIGAIVLFATVVWFIYRIVKGWLYLNDNRPMYQ